MDANENLHPVPEEMMVHIHIHVHSLVVQKVVYGDDVKADRENVNDC